VEALPLALADLDEAAIGPDRDVRAERRRIRDRRRDRAGRRGGPGEWRVGDLERRAWRDGKRRRGGGMGQPGPDETGLGDPVGRQRRLRLALEAALDDERRLAVPDEDQ